MSYVIKVFVFISLLVAVTAFGNPSQAQLQTGHVESPRPDLPFPGNPDPDACGIPQRWGSDVPAQLTGFYRGKLAQPTVFLYDSHARRAVTGQAESGTKVRVLLFQSNPTLNFYLVKTLGTNPQEGWVPAPFLKLEPQPDLAEVGAFDPKSFNPEFLSPSQTQ